jgi:hypothetical protein
MKQFNIISSLIIGLVFLPFLASSQSPEAFNFQGIARDMSGNPLVNKTIGLEFALIQGDAQGPILYLEAHQVTTNENALFSVAIGRGLVRFGDIGAIDWSSGPFFMRTALDETGGSNYTVVGSSELLSVPFALYALNGGESVWTTNDDGINYSQGNVGISTANPAEKLHVNNGNIYIEQRNDGIIMRSPNGNCWKQTVSNEGESIWTEIPCPVSSGGNNFPSIIINPNALQFSFEQNQKSLFLENNGNILLNWSMSYPNSLLSVTPSSGSLSPGQSTQTFITLDRSTMPDEVVELTIDFTTDQGLDRTISLSIDNMEPIFPPSLVVVLPTAPAEFSEGEEINFSVDVTDQDSPNEDITVTWTSNLDGELHVGSLNSAGNASFSTTNLSKGEHLITIEAADTDNQTDVATIQVSTLLPSPIILATPEKTPNGILLNWNENQQSNFKKYDVFRSDNNCTDANKVLIASITDQSETSFVDEFAPLEFQVCYFVEVRNEENQFRKSNNQVIDFPSGYIFNFIPYDMLKHPTQEYIYLLDQGGQRLIKYDYNAQEIVGETNLQGTIGYCAIGDNGFGVEIYTPSNNGSIYIYNADDLSLVTSINTGLPTTSVAVNGLGHVIAALLPNPWWDQPVRTYLRSNGLNLDGNGDFDGDRLRMIPGKNELISISTGVSPVDMEYFQLTNDGFINLHQDDQYHGDYPLNPRIFRVSNDGTYSITSSNGAVYLANSSMEYKGELQRGSLEFSDFAFSDDGSIIYAGTSNRRSIQLGSYPSLIRNDEILTKGFPIIIERDGNKIISVSKQEDDSINTGVEVILIN